MKDGAAYLEQILPHGFESSSLTFWRTIGDVDIETTARKVKETLGDRAAISSRTDVISSLRMNDYKGSIDIEGQQDPEDPVYKVELEMTRQFFGLNYLKQCRGGEFVPNSFI